jgi:membrane dipeptidase
VTPIVDAHNDLLVELAYRSSEENPFGNLWLEQLRAGGVGIQVCPLSTQFEHIPDSALRHGLAQVAAFHRAVAENPRDVIVVRSRADLERARESGAIGLLLAMEGADPLGSSIDLADAFWHLGVRMFSLTWNRRNAFADGVGEPATGGLSKLGRALIARLTDLGAIVDLAHASEQTFADVLDQMDGGSVIVSHAACRAVLETPRNLHDGQMRALAERGGVLGIMVLPPAIDPDDPTIARVVDHIDHAVSVMGIEHVGLGADFFRQVALSGAVRKPPDSLRPPGMGLEYSIDDLAGPADYPRLVDALRGRGYHDEALAALLGQNFLRVFREALPAVGPA